MVSMVVAAGGSVLVVSMVVAPGHMWLPRSGTVAPVTKQLSDGFYLISVHLDFNLLFFIFLLFLIPFIRLAPLPHHLWTVGDHKSDVFFHEIFWVCLCVVLSFYRFQISARSLTV